MHLLSNIKNSCLWVLQNNDAAKENLRKFADRYGMARRLIFAEMLPRRQHLERMACADLALDTRYYNGHTTTSDALWAGLPVVTLEGEHFASRVSASLLRAMDLPELITSTTKGMRIELSNLRTMARCVQQLDKKLKTTARVRPCSTRLDSRGHWRRHTPRFSVVTALVRRQAYSTTQVELEFILRRLKRRYHHHRSPRHSGG